MIYKTTWCQLPIKETSVQHSKCYYVWNSEESETLQYKKVFRFADGRGRHVCQHTATVAAEWCHLSCRSADRQHADHISAANSPVCVWTVAHKHFAPASPLVVSLSRTKPDVARSDFSDLRPDRDELEMVNFILWKSHNETICPIELFRQSGDDTTDTSVLHQNHILFLWNEEA